ncbi:hypothetical protein BDB01DRAFT_793518 [Pilobolus umbonatus]|nr:hypothetical protein BDB01DRAFT_793518 [Pilobolus umbonatus]
MMDEMRFEYEKNHRHDNKYSEEHSYGANYDSSCYNLDYYDSHSVIQSYPECKDKKKIFSKPRHHVSRLSCIKTKMKKVFQFNHHHTPSLPLFSQPKSWDIPSLDSSGSSTTIARSHSYQMTSSTSSLLLDRDYPSQSTLDRLCFTPSYISRSTPIKGILKQPRPEIKVVEEQTKPHRKSWSIRLSFHNSTRRKSMLSFRRKKEEDQAKVRFNKFNLMHDTYSHQEYDRSSDPDAICTRLTPTIAQHIKQELNHYKLNEMKVHDSSRVYTHFFL